MAMMEAATVTCNQCARSFRWKPDLAGKKVKCKCGGRIAFPSAEPTLSPENQPLAIATGAPSTYTDAADNDALIGLADDPLDLSPLDTPSPSAPPQLALCPTCKNPVPPQNVLCTRCGTNLRTGAKLKTNVKGPGPEASDVARKAGKVVLALVLGGITSVICAVLWITIIVLTHFTIGYMAVGLGLATGGVMRLINRNGGTLSGFAAAGFALFAFALVKGFLVLVVVNAGEPAIMAFRPFDILWVILAVSSAFRLGGGLGS